MCRYQERYYKTFFCVVSVEYILAAKIKSCLFFQLVCAVHNFRQNDNSSNNNNNNNDNDNDDNNNNKIKRCELKQSKNYQKVFVQSSDRTANCIILLHKIVMFGPQSGFVFAQKLYSYKNKSPAF